MTHTPVAAITRNTILVWLRRDLRLSDNAALYYALRAGDNVLPLFIFDTAILDTLEDKADRRVAFIHESLTFLKKELEALQTSLVVVYGNPLEIFKGLTPRAVFANHDYEPYAIARDQKVKDILESRGVAFRTFKDHVIFEKNEITKGDGNPYTVFTPYCKKWKSTLDKFFLKTYPTEKYFSSFKKIQPQPLPSPEDIGFTKTTCNFPDRRVHQAVIAQYHKLRDFPSIRGTTRQSVHLRFGTVSIRKLVQLAKGTSEAWLNELIWRDFYHMILWHFPQVETRAFKPAYDLIQWRNDPAEFNAWCDGRTGYPIVDAGMRELNATGFMHNRVRMITASFLTKHLLVDWRWGEANFAKKLLDFDLAANNGGWQWAAGSGCDAAPYFRVFNPALQTQKFDRQHQYIRQWIPEFDTPSYPKPIVDHQVARERALRVYAEALPKRSKSPTANPLTYSPNSMM